MILTNITTVRMISTHTLRKEGDYITSLRNKYYRISTHTLRKEGDQTTLHANLTLHHFNPHPPQGG